ncbi:hypothetical protein Q3G72_012859 [Acer saccharum]|nr:hypothetical protein Q3G72_012859 [Acer saccharum]
MDFQDIDTKIQNSSAAFFRAGFSSAVSDEAGFDGEAWFGGGAWFDGGAVWWWSWTRKSAGLNQTQSKLIVLTSQSPQHFVHTAASLGFHRRRRQRCFSFSRRRRVTTTAFHFVAVAPLFSLRRRRLITDAPDFVFTSEIQSPRLFICKVLLDRGAVQADALTVDRLASLKKYSETADLETEVEWLNKIKADLLMLEFALFVSPTSEYVMAAGNNHRSIVWQGICHG